MMMNTTLNQLRSLRLETMAQALEQQLQTSGITAMSFEERLALGEWVAQGHAVLITGATGSGKSWLVCALAQHACRRGQSAYYQRVPRLSEELRIRHANGTFTRWLETLKNTDVRLLDDWAIWPWMRRPEPTCWRSLMTVPIPRQPSSLASCRSSTGTNGLATRRLLTRCWTG